MKTISRAVFFTLVIVCIAFSNAFTQNKVVVVKHKHSRGNVVVAKKNHHVRRARAYHPHWAPRKQFHRRWVYFPRYNFYWDNHRNVYVVRTGTVWLVCKTAPKEVETVDLSKEKSIELSEENDTQEAIQDRNNEHQTEYKVK